MTPEQRDHGLYGSTSCCKSHGPCQWERAIFDPHSSETPQPIFMKLEIYKHDPACKISGAYVDVGGLGK